MDKIDISGIEPVEKLFHNENIKTYQKNLSFTKIHHWPKNLRTLLAFEVLVGKVNKLFKDITLEELTFFLAERSELKLSKLAKSIGANGVRVPLIVLDDGTLLDGNRRYFACSYLYHSLSDKNTLPEYLNKIPVLVIKKKDITPAQQNKILAEANFVEDFKVPWTLDVKAKVIDDYFQQCKAAGNTDENVYSEIEDVYGLKKSDVAAYVETVKLTKEFIERSNEEKEKRLNLREIVLKKFVYFWEFRNKAYKGRGKLDEKELKKVKPLFFTMIENNCFRNIKQVEPMIRAYHTESWWKILKDSNGTQIPQVEALYFEKNTKKNIKYWW